MRDITPEQALKTFEAMSPEEQEKLIRQTQTLAGNMPWVPNAGPQTQAYYSKADLLLYGGQAGGGKALRADAPVLTPFGWRAIADLKVGSSVCATDGTVTRVIGVYPQGVRPMLRFTFKDGAQVDCDEDHAWLAWDTRKTRKISNARVSGEAAARKWTAREIAEHYQRGQGPLAIPTISAPAAFNVAGARVGPDRYQKRVVPPYVLGVLLGDGYLSDRGVKFSSADDEIAARVADELGCDLSAYETGSAAMDYRIPNAVIMDDLRALGLLGKLAHEKSIPRIYQFGTELERWALLQGLMDTDGWVEEGRSAYFVSVSEALATDTAFLARSLGAIVSVTTKTPTYTGADGEKKQGRLAYCLRIKHPMSGKLFHLARKREAAKRLSYQSMGRTIVRVEPAPSAEAVCIQVAHPNSLFITNDFIVTHNSELLLGLAMTAHRMSLLMRREYVALGGLLDRAQALLGRDKVRVAPPPRAETEDGRIVLFGAVQQPGDEQNFQGRARDFLGLDEATQFLETQVRFLMGWVRTADANQRARTVLATNPPVDAAGDWIIGMFRPWLDLTYPAENKAEPGELRWFITDSDGSDVEVEGATPIERSGQVYIPTSRTFIPATLADNPYLVKTGYQSTLDALPEPLRSAVRDGNFMAARADAEFQVIPAEWVRDAQQRWTKTPPEGAFMDAMGVDVAQGGADETVISRRRGTWFDELVVVPGKQTPEGSDVAALVTKYRYHGATVVIDMGGGYGAAPREHLVNNGVDVRKYNGANASGRKAKGSDLKFANKRAESWWRLREALDPNQDGGSKIALPDDPALLADLTAPTFKVSSQGLRVEAKDDIRKRLGRSTDRGDAVVMAWAVGGKPPTPAEQFRDVTMRNTPPQVKFGRSAQKRRR